jgi:hypothetical protein
VRSRVRNRWWRVAIGVWAGGVLLAAPVLAADPAYLAEMPTADQVVAKIQGSDPFDTAARQYVAFSRLESMMLELEGDRSVTNKTTAAENALSRTYHDGYLRVQAELLASLPEDERIARADTKYGQWRALIDTYCCKGGNASDPFNNAEFSDTLLKAFFSKSFRASYAKIHAVTVADLKQAAVPDPLPPERAPGPDTSRIPIALFLIVLNIGLFGAGARGGYGRRSGD